jgi:thiol-disulfide isomerase/thioredoxin
MATVFALTLSAADEKKDAKKNGDKPAASEKEASEKETGEKEANEEKPVDLDKVPEGSNEERVEYLKKVLRMEPKSREESMKILDTINKTADKILDSSPSEDDMNLIIGLRMQIPMEPEACGAFGEKLAKLGADFTKAGKADFGRELTSMSYVMKLRATGEDNEAFKKAVGESLKYLGDGKLQKGDLMLAMTIASGMDQMDDQKFAADTLEKVIKLLKETKIEGLEINMEEMILKPLEGTLRRFKLVGNKIELEGNLLTGEKLDLKNYEGKVLLVDFWATWCPPCIAEIPNMKKNYEAYRDKGFEIVGLSCDRDKDTVEKFVKAREIPWAIVYGDKGPSPSFEYYGISGIPQMILVGKDGKVISTSARGEELDKLLEKQLGPAEKKEPKNEEKKLQLKKTTDKKPADKKDK